MSNTVSLIDMAPTPVAYHRHTGPYGQPVARFWMERVAPWMAEPRVGVRHLSLLPEPWDAAGV